MAKTGWIVCGCLVVMGCGDGSPGGQVDHNDVGSEGGDVDVSQWTQGEQVVVAAKQSIPTMLDLHTTVFQRTCSPDGGVCHNSKEYPDLHTAGNLLDSVWKPCNLAESGYQDVLDMCEPPGEVLEITTGEKTGFKTRIAWTEPQGSQWAMALEEAVPGECWPHVAGFRILAGDGTEEVLLEVPQEILQVKCGTPTVYLNYFLTFGPELQDALMWRVRGGDPNKNGIFGFDEGGALIVPNDVARSYLLLRVLGVVPGTPMPLANQPLDHKELLALMCWIETMSENPTPLDPIDYDGCEAAKTVMETGDLPALTSPEVDP